MPLKIGMVSLGCSKNRVDAEIMLATLQKNGFEITSDDKKSDIIIINTCGFIEDAKKEAIDTIFDYVRMKQSAQRKISIIVTGCLAERYRDEIRQEIPEVDVVVSIGANGDIAEICNKAASGEQLTVSAEKRALPLNGERILTTPPHYAYLKIAEGCNNRCAYCAIPSIRGDFRSRRMEDILTEVNILAQKGVKEIIVVAQDVTRYGSDIYEKIMLPELLQEICKIDGIEWVRLMYCYPDKISDELLDVIDENKKIVRYMDLPIQHCNGEILGRMNRSGDKNVLLELIKKIRLRFPDMVIRTTMMVGFPGETDEQFAQLDEFVGEAEFDRLGCFSFSPEEGTPAAEMENQIDIDVKVRRMETIMLHQHSITTKKLKEHIGKEIEVLVDGYDEESGMWYGRSYMDAPEVDPKIFFPAGKDTKTGSFLNVIIEKSDDCDLIGRDV